MATKEVIVITRRPHYGATNAYREVKRRISQAHRCQKEAKLFAPGKSRSTIFGLARYWIDATRWAEELFLEQLVEAAKEGFVYIDGNNVMVESKGDRK